MKVLNIGGRGASLRIFGGGGGGGGGGQTFRWLLTNRRASPAPPPPPPTPAPASSRLQSVPNNYISHIKTDNIAKLRIELKRILSEIPSNVK